MGGGLCAEAHPVAPLLRPRRKYRDEHQSASIMDSEMNKLTGNQRIASENPLPNSTLSTCGRNRLWKQPWPSDKVAFLILCADQRVDLGDIAAGKLHYGCIPIVGFVGIDEHRYAG